MHHSMIILYFHLPYFHVSKSALFFLQNNLKLSFYINIDFTLSIRIMLYDLISWPIVNHIITFSVVKDILLEDKNSFIIVWSLPCHWGPNNKTRAYIILPPPPLPPPPPPPHTHTHTQYSYFNTRGPFYQYEFVLIPAWICNHMSSNMWDEITHPFPYFNGTSIEIWEWKSNFISHFIMDSIIYSYLGVKLTDVSKMGPRWG